MKTLIATLLISFGSLAQSYTEKYDSLNQRYEYFNNQGTMVGYKYYDGLNQAWVYKDLSEKPKSTYIDPINNELIQQVLSSKDRKYESNVQKIQNAISDINSKILTLSEDEETKNIIRTKFNDVVNGLNSKNRDYSNNNTANQIVQYLYEMANTITKQTTFKKSYFKDNEIVSFMQYHGGYDIPIIKEYVMKNNLWVLTKTDKGNNQFYYDGDVIYFKRGETLWKNRPIKFRNNNPLLKGNWFDSPYGEVFITDDFKICTLIDVDANNKPVKKYEFPIGNYSQFIKPN